MNVHLDYHDGLLIGLSNIPVCQMNFWILFGVLFKTNIKFVACPEYNTAMIASKNGATGMMRGQGELAKNEEAINKDMIDCQGPRCLFPIFPTPHCAMNPKIIHLHLM